MPAQDNLSTDVDSRTGIEYTRTMGTGYHGSQDKITVISGTICLTGRRQAAEEYALYKDCISAEQGWLHVINLDDSARIAGEDDLMAAAGGGWDYVYEAADDDAVRAALAGQGFAGVQYGDQTIRGTAHDTILVWDTAAVTITAVGHVTSY